MDFYTKNNNKDDGISDIFKKKANSITGHHLTGIMGIMVEDLEAIGVSTKLDPD